MSHGREVLDGSLEALRQRCESWRSRGEKLVTTNGCFDILHAGHIEMLLAARELGDRLIVGLNSDDSVRRLKGEDRPVVPERERAATLAALPFVDLVEIFGEDTPDAVLEAVRPDVHAKGGDYEARDLPEYDLIAGMGGELVIVPEVPGVHSSDLLDAYRQRTEG